MYTSDLPQSCAICGDSRVFGRKSVAASYKMSFFKADQCILT
jgi:hypothetical protein